MASNNLRIIYQNLADIASSTILTSSTASSATTTANLKTDIKSLVYRSASSGVATIHTNFVVTLPTAMSIGGIGSGIGVILTNTNLSASATIKVTAYDGTAATPGTGTAPIATAGTTLRFTSGPTLCNPYQSTGINDWKDKYLGTLTTASMDFVNRKVYSRLWIPQTIPVNCTSFLIEITDTASVNQFIQCSRIIIGEYWSPTYNTNYGLGAGVKDLSNSIRTEAGDLISSNDPLINTLTFDIGWLTNSDRAILNKVLKLCGNQKPVFVSLFPDNTIDWEKEQIYQLYGKFNQLSDIVHFIVDMYNSKVSLEEV